MSKSSAIITTPTAKDDHVHQLDNANATITVFKTRGSGCSGGRSKTRVERSGYNRPLRCNKNQGKLQPAMDEQHANTISHMRCHKTDNNFIFLHSIGKLLKMSTFWLFLPFWHENSNSIGQSRDTKTIDRIFGAKIQMRHFI